MARRYTQPQIGPARISPEFFDGSALCLLPTTLDLTNLAQSNPGKRLTKASPVLAVTKSGRGVACSNTTRSYVDSNWLSPIQTSQSDGRGEFSVLIVITFRSSGSRAFPFHIRENAGVFNSVFLVQNGYYTDGGDSSIAQSGTLYFGTFDGANGAAGIALPGVLTSTPREFKLLFNRFADGSRELWVDGVLAASAGPSISRPICTGAAQYLSIGGNALNDGLASNDPITLVYAANKTFAPLLSSELTSNPWRIFAAPAISFASADAGGGTDHTLTGSGITTSPATLSSPALAQNHSITGSAISTSAVVLGSPSVAQNHVVTATGIAASPATLSSPTITQNHALTASSITTGAATLSSPTISGDAYNLTGSSISTTPTLSSPALTQNHALIGGAIAAGAPTFGTPTIEQQHALMADGIATESPTLSAPVLSDGSLPIYTSAPSGSGYRRDMADTIRPAQRNTVRR